ncbi:MAG: lipoprotein signal peptidase [Bacterioplanes sp.]|nr:lipoprotein signal peptidase [Bacterioplanes sp.]
MTLPTINQSAVRWLWLSLLVFVLDIATKQMASAWLIYARPVEILPVLDFTLLHNPGAAFSMLANQPGWQRCFLSLIAAGVSVMLVVWIVRTPREQVWLPVALALILGGAVGNLFDRVVYGYVIDFISVHYNGRFFPAFNIADSAISVGAAMMIVDVIRDMRRGASANNSSS